MKVLLHCMAAQCSGGTMQQCSESLVKAGARLHHTRCFFQRQPPQMDLFRQRPHTDALSKKSNEDLPRNQELEMWQILEEEKWWCVAGGVGYFTARFVDKASFTEGMPWSRPTAATEGKCTWASTWTWRIILRLGGPAKEGKSHVTKKE